MLSIAKKTGCLPLAMLALSGAQTALARDARIVDLEMRGGSFVAHKKGTLTGAEADEYVLNLVAGKLVSVNVVGAVFTLTVQPPDGSAAIRSNGMATALARYTAATDGDYVLSVALTEGMDPDDNTEFAYDMGIIVSRLPE